ncbi:hypothetical protein [Micromonospora sp. DT227]|uniref:hypothetical protein n=1 Tax=Micromonospora sp. DT227 TaxID=3393433 RepID=UPI003CF44C03
MPFGMHGWNPFMWLYGLTALRYLAGLASPLLAGYGVVLLARDRRSLPRGLRALLLAGVVAGVVLTVLRFTPVGADMQAWWLD